MLKLFLTGRRLWMTLVVLLGVALLCRLGIWQLDRHAQRAARNQLINERMALPPLPLDGSPVSPDELDYRWVQVRGVFDPQAEVLLRNRSYNGATGYHILTPLRISGSDAAVLVDRGWVPLSATDPDVRREFAPPAGEVTLEGVARRSQEDMAGPQDPPTGPERPRLDAWFRVDIARIEQQTGYPLLPVFIEQQPDPDAPPGPPFPAATTDLGLGSHLGYAFQWFSFALILLVGYVVVILRHSRPAPQQSAV
nr:MAG: SURF1 family protein [Chloroflexota bacterium]